MMYKRLHVALMDLLLAVCLTTGCNRPNQTVTAPPAVPTKTPSAPPPQETAPSISSSPSAPKTPIKDAVNQLLDQQAAAQNPVIPPGTKLLHASLKEGVVTLDFSSEFNRVADMGDTTEAEAQKKLRGALSHIFGVEKLRVTVEGKPVDSQMTDWDKPFPIRYDGSPNVHSSPSSNNGGEE